MITARLCTFVQKLDKEKENDMSKIGVVLIVTLESQGETTCQGAHQHPKPY